MATLEIIKEALVLVAAILTAILLGLKIKEKHLEIELKRIELRKARKSEGD